MTNCPACSAPENIASVFPNVVICQGCGGFYTTKPISRVESYFIVKPHFTDDASADDRQIYFDFDVLGSDGPSRRHGWFDPKTRLVTQTG